MNRAAARAELARLAREVAVTHEGDQAIQLIERAGAAPGPGLVALLLLEGARTVLREAAA